MDPELSALNLSIKFAGDTSQLKNDIDGIVGSFYDIQDQLLKSINSIIGSISANMGDINVEFIKVSDNAILIKDNSHAINEVLKLTNRSYENIGENNAQILDDTNKLILLHNKDNKLSVSSNDLIKSASNSITKLVKADSHRLLLSRDINKQYKTEGEYIEGIFTKITNLIGVIDRKNISHQDEINLVNEESKAIDNLTGGFGNWADSFISADAVLSSMVDDLRLLVKELDVASRETEKFVAVNYRQYGSQQEIRKSIMNMARDYNVLHESAEETFIAMAKLNVPADQIIDLSAAVTQFQRATQTSVDSSAQYVKMMRQIGMNTMQVTESLEFVISAQRKFGLASGDVNNVISDTSISVKQLGAAFKISYDDFVKGKIIAAGLAKSMNLSAESMNNVFNNIVSSTEARAQLMALVGPQALNIKTTEDMIALLPKLSDNYKAMVNQFGNGSLQAQASLSAISQAFGLAEKDTQQFLLAFDQANLQNKFGVQNIQDLNKALTDLQKPLADTTAEANASAYMQWTLIIQELHRWVHLIGVELDAVFAPALKNVFEYVKFGGEVVGQLVNNIKSMWNAVKTQFPFMTTAAEYLTTAVAAAAVVIGGLAIVLTPLALAVGLVAKAFTLFSSAMRVTTTLGTAMSRMVVQLSTAASSSMVVLGRGFATAILTVGRAAMRVAPGLLALSASIVGVGASVYLVANSMEIMASLGDKLWTSFGAVAAIIAVVGVAIVALAVVAQPLAAGFGILALTMLAAGAAIAATSLAMNAFAKILEAIPAALGAFVVSVKSLSVVELTLLTASLTTLTVALGAFGVAALGLVPATAALSAFAAVATVSNVGITLLAGSMTILKTAVVGMPAILIELSGALTTVTVAMIASAMPIAIFNVNLLGFASTSAFATPVIFALAGAITALAVALDMLPERLDKLANTDLFKSGTKVISTFVNGIMSSGGSAVNAVVDILAKIRRYLPFSDAKEGPLSDLTYSGSAMIKAFSDGIEKAASPVDSVSKHLRDIGRVIDIEVKKMDMTVDAHAANVQDTINNKLAKAVAQTRVDAADIQASTISNVKLYNNESNKNNNDPLINEIRKQSETINLLLDAVVQISEGNSTEQIVRAIKEASGAKVVHSGFGSTINDWN